LAHFEREAILPASLNHADITATHRPEAAEGKRFLALEFVAGETLAQRIAKGPLPIDEALEVCRQIGEGLEAAHEWGIIHRDLKPANIKVTPEGRVKLLFWRAAFQTTGDCACETRFRPDLNFLNGSCNDPADREVCANLCPGSFMS
jgi:hypothetical protein